MKPKPETPPGLDAETLRRVRWHHAMHPTTVPPVASLSRRQATFRRELRWFATEMVIMAAIAAAIVFSTIYYIPAVVKLLLPEVETVRDPQWWVTATVVWIGSLVVPAAMLRPRRPTEADVEVDVSLRRAAGMNDSVSD